MTKSALSQDKEYENILIIGGGDLRIASMILQKYRVQKLTVCEIDRCVVDVVKQFFPICEEVIEAEKLGKLKIVYLDGAEYLKE